MAKAVKGIAYLGAKLDQRLDEHRRLYGHVQAAGDASALQDLRWAVLLAARHQAGHLVLRNDDRLASPFGEIDIGCHRER